MKSILIIFKNIRNLLPYFLLISIYFFFVNLEARKEMTNKLESDEENLLPVDKSSSEVRNLRITIPVVPYNE